MCRERLLTITIRRFWGWKQALEGRSRFSTSCLSPIAAVNRRLSSETPHALNAQGKDLDSVKDGNGNKKKTDKTRYQDADSGMSDDDAGLKNVHGKKVKKVQEGKKVKNVKKVKEGSKGKRAAAAVNDDNAAPAKKPKVSKRSEAEKDGVNVNGELNGVVCKNGVKVSGKQRAQLRPNGCPTCRNRPGCTASCWAKRNVVL